MKNLFNNLVKIGNNNPELRDDIKPILQHLKKSFQDRTAIDEDMSLKDYNGKEGKFKKDLLAELMEEFERLLDSFEYSSMKGLKEYPVAFYGIEDGKFSELFCRVDLRERGVVCKCNHPEKGEIKIPYYFASSDSISEIVEMVGKEVSFEIYGRR